MGQYPKANQTKVARVSETVWILRCRKRHVSILAGGARTSFKPGIITVTGNRFDTFGKQFVTLLGGEVQGREAQTWI